jgi:glycosyltransferase involved in cell wall biosynthesis
MTTETHAQPDAAGTNPTLDASVVVSTYQRAALLPEFVSAIERQTLPADRFELVVVNNGSSDGTSDVLADLARSTSVQLRVVELAENQGSSGGRNAGWRAARGAVIAFTDDDCLPEPGWLAAGLAAMDDADLVQGATRPVRRIGALERSVQHATFSGLFPTCNVFYRRTTLDELGGFDVRDGVRLGFKPDAFGRTYGFGEDTLFAWRVARGGRVTFAPEAVVRHAVLRPKVSEMILREWATSGFPALIREVPELRKTLLRHRVFLGTRRIPLYMLIVGGAATREPFVIVALLGLWVSARAREMLGRPGSIGRRIGAVAVELGVDVVTAGALVWGSARTRTLVL